MNKKITAISLAILIVALSVTVGSIKLSGNLNYLDSYVNLNTYAAKQTTETTQSLGDFVGDKVENVTILGDIVGDASDVIGDLGGSLGGGLGNLGGLGDAIGGIGDALGGLIQDANGGSSNNGGSGNNSPTYNVNSETMAPIDIVPAVSNYNPVIPSSSVPASTASTVNETVDFSATKNPYKKPDGDLKGGATGDGVKWMQWIFIYTRYGLKDNGITGVFDEDTVAVVKKLQKENGLVTDGIVNDEVKDKIELLYFQATYSTSSPAEETTASTTLPVVQNVSENKDDNAGFIVLAIIVAVVWLIAIGFIVAFFIIKKKKKSGKKSKVKKGNKAEDTVVEEAKAQVTANSEVTQDDYSDLGDLFNENN